MTKLNLWITLKKAGIILCELLVAGAIVYVTDIPELIFLLPVLEGLRNIIKIKTKK